MSSNLVILVFFFRSIKMCINIHKINDKKKHIFNALIFVGIGHFYVDFS